MFWVQSRAVWPWSIWIPVQKFKNENMHSSVTETKMGMWSTFSQLTRSHFTKSTIHLPLGAQTVSLTLHTDTWVYKKSKPEFYVLALKHALSQWIKMPNLIWKLVLTIVANRSIMLSFYQKGQFLLKKLIQGQKGQ